MVTVGATKLASFERAVAARSMSSVPAADSSLPATVSSVPSVSGAAVLVRNLLRAAASAPATESIAACAVVKVLVMVRWRSGGKVSCWLVS